MTPDYTRGYREALNEIESAVRAARLRLRDEMTAARKADISASAPEAKLAPPVVERAQVAEAPTERPIVVGSKWQGKWQGSAGRRCVVLEVGAGALPIVACWEDDQLPMLPWSTHTFLQYFTHVSDPEPAAPCGPEQCGLPVPCGDEWRPCFLKPGHRGVCYGEALPARDPEPAAPAIPFAPWPCSACATARQAARRRGADRMPPLCVDCAKSSAV